MQVLIRGFLNGSLGWVKVPSPNSAATPAMAKKKLSESDKPDLDMDKCFKTLRTELSNQNAESKLDLFTEWDTLVEDVLVKDISKHYPMHRFITEDKINHKRRSESRLSISKPSYLKHALIMHGLGTDFSYPVSQLQNIERVTSTAHALSSVGSSQRNVCMVVQEFANMADQDLIQLQQEPGDDQPEDWIKSESEDSEDEAEPEYKPKRKRSQRKENVKTRPAERIDSPPDPPLPGHSL
ncbi:uncharacterized protein LOC6571306 [Drosophila grimshawi]|nr:uncharacterized protein LOC6571306 [Drosophila grimshawi]